MSTYRGNGIAPQTLVLLLVDRPALENGKHLALGKPKLGVDSRTYHLYQRHLYRGGLVSLK